jgi:hypothetical protein
MHVREYNYYPEPYVPTRPTMHPTPSPSPDRGVPR